MNKNEPAYWHMIGSKVVDIAWGKRVGLEYLRKGILHPKPVETEPDYKPSYVEFHYRTIGTTLIADVRAITDDIAMGLGVRDLRVQSAGPHLAIQIKFSGMRSFSQEEGIEMFRAKCKPFDFLVGIGYDHKMVTGNYSMTECAHVLISGTTGCGKSNLAQSMLHSLTVSTRPKNLQVILLDATKSNSRFANTIGHHVHTHATTTQEARFALGRLIASLKARQPAETGQEPRIVVYCDELPELCRQGGDEIVQSIETISNIGRGIGVHLMVCAQYPKKGEVSSTIKANATLRITGKTASATISTLCTGVPSTGCERLGGSGDFIAMFGTHDKRVQACLVTNPEPVEPSYDINAGWKPAGYVEPDMTEQEPEEKTTKVSADLIAQRERATAELSARIAIVLSTSATQLSMDEISKRATGKRVEGETYSRRFKTAYAAAKQALDTPHI